MTLDQLLGRLENVAPRGSRYLATCPAHADRHPSLQVTPGDTGLLLKCWAGCRVGELCQALGIQQRDLFYDTHYNNPTRQRPPKPIRLDRIALAFRFELAALDRRLRSERVLTATRHLDGFTLTDATRERLTGIVASAHADRERAELFEYIADTLRGKVREEKRITDAA